MSAGRTMRRSRPAVAFVLIVVVGLAGLLAAAAGDRRPVAFSLNEPGLDSLAPFAPGQQACQRNVRVPAPFAGMQAYVGIDRPVGARLDVTVRPALGGAALARGELSARRPSGTPRYQIGLDRTVASGQSVTICFRDLGPSIVALLGGTPQLGPAQDSALTLTVAGYRTESEARLVFLLAHPPTLLSDLPTVFARAALFRPGWVGVWTFWVLAAGLLAAIGPLALAIRAAAAEDGAD